MAPPERPVQPGNTELKPNETHQGPTLILSPSRIPASKPTAKTPPKDSTSIAERQETVAVTTITEGVENLLVTDQAHTQIGEKVSDRFPISRSHGSDEASSHLSGSSNKPNGSDTKSLVSDNTFAMEEKESLRPDDSASVQAADDEEPFFVPPMLIRPDAQQGLEIVEDNLQSSEQERELPQHQAMGYSVVAMGQPPRFGDMMPATSPVYPPLMTDPDSFARDPEGVANAPRHPGSLLPPDAKLIEAMGAPKDRFFVLQLEEKLAEFIQQSK